jgi:hypothetical protein
MGNAPINVTLESAKRLSGVFFDMAPAWLDGWEIPDIWLRQIPG